MKLHPCYLKADKGRLVGNNDSAWGAIPLLFGFSGKRRLNL